MYNVYEVYTWDDVDYRKVASFEEEPDALIHCDLLNKEHRENAKEPDPICYRVLSDAQYYSLMHETHDPLPLRGRG